MATVASIVVHCVTGLIGWTAAVMTTGLSSFDIVDHSSSDQLILDWHEQEQQVKQENAHHHLTR